MTMKTIAMAMALAMMMLNWIPNGRPMLASWLLPSTIRIRV